VNIWPPLARRVLEINDGLAAGRKQQEEDMSVTDIWQAMYDVGGAP